MTPAQITLVRSGWSTLPVGRQEFAARCYTTLFAAQPQLRVLFEGFLDDQHKKLADTLDKAIGQLHEHQALAPVLKELGRRHRDYGVKDHHYAAVGDALISTLAELHGTAFTPEAREAWISFYGELAAAMRGTHGQAG